MNEKLTNKIKKILTEHNLYYFPIDVIKLAQYEGFTILQQNLNNISGAVLVNINQSFEIDNKKYNKVILIDNNQGYARKKFTVAHELGHYFLEFNDKEGEIYAHREDSSIHMPNERKANDFASELLMPYELIDKFVNEIKKTCEEYYLITRAIADAFSVSLSAAEFRYDKYLRGY